MLNNKRSGTYTIRGNDVLYNGTVITKPAVLRNGDLTLQNGGAWIVSIDGRSSRNYGGFGSYTRAQILGMLNRDKKKIFIWPTDFPQRITEFHFGEFYLPPGEHTIEVVYLAVDSDGINYSTDSMIWEQRYLFEGYTYEVTADLTPDGKRIQYGIRRQ
jgi:hypothetical protein